MINRGIIVQVIGVLLTMLAGFMLSTWPVALYHEGGDAQAILLSVLTTSIAGMSLWVSCRKAAKKIGKREGFLIVALGWMAISIFSALPYLFGSILPSVTTSLFESVSGLTTTGATVIDDIESLPKGILLWRSMTQWLGGMGIIVLTVAILPLLGIGGVELFVAEAPGPTSDKIHPRIKETAKRLWFIYLGLTALLTALLALCGMSPYDAFNHALTTMATGGFSTKNDSIAHFSSPGIQYILILFMFLAGVNYTVIYYSLRGRFRKVWGSDEFKTYLSLVLLLILFVTVVLVQVRGGSLEQSFRDAAFQVVSIITTTGYITEDYTSWTPGLTMFFFILLFTGACAGSTSGGIKIIRHLVFFKNSLLELKRLLHPKAIIRTKIDTKIVAPRILMHILVFLLLYLMLFVLGSIVMSAILTGFDQPLVSSIGVVATALGNVGPAIGDFGPMDNLSAMPPAGMWVLALLMLLGRLELFTILVLATPYFWRKN